MYEIRTMQIADYREAYSLWSESDGVTTRDADTEQGFARFLQRNPDTCFVAVAEQMILGTVLAGDDGRRGYVHHLAVQNQHRGKGIGNALLEHAINALSRNGVSKCHVHVLAENASALEFYTHKEWTKREDLTVFSRSTHRS